MTTLLADPPTLLGRQQLLGNYLLAGFSSLGLPGLPAVSCAAVVGNATQENNCRSVTLGVQDHGSDGLMQWRLTRLTEMKTWCGANFGDWQAIEPQAAFFLFECKRDCPALWTDLVAGKESLATLTLNITDAYERPSAAGRVADTRIGYAATFLSAWVPATTTIVHAPAPPTPVPTPSPPAAVPVAPVALPGVTALNPILMAIIVQLGESIGAGIVKGISPDLGNQLLASLVAPGTPLAPAPIGTPVVVTPPAVDIGSLAAGVAPLVSAALTSTLPGLIASELATVLPGLLTQLTTPPPKT